ncbi:hypothetical protein [Niveibacterium terrae]|uniref:hypothetical protein n=1 Tax=Niveibacterium terrae TaxID=3373598 RepID=UPI003A8CBC7B
MAELRAPYRNGVGIVKGERESCANAEFVAAANPATVLELIRGIRLLRGRTKNCETMGEAQKMSLIRMAQEICQATGLNELDSSPNQIVAAVAQQAEELREARELAAEAGSLREFVKKISDQIPEKPDHWSMCGQCDRNIGEAEDIIEELAGKGGAWRPIDTAPKDGTRVLLWWANATRIGWCAGIGASRDGGDWWRVPSMEVSPTGRPNLWMPLPDGPDADAIRARGARGGEKC